MEIASSKKLRSFNHLIANVFERIKFNTDQLDLYYEDEFIKMLSRERMRSKRSNMHFILMLIDIKKIIKSKSDLSKIKTIASVLKEISRETDIKGWYRDDSTLGVIFVGIDESNIDSAKEIIARKLQQKLTEHLQREFLDMLTISFLIYPEKLDIHKPDSSLEQALYPEVSNSGVSEVLGRFFKRALDIKGSLAGLLLFSPLFIIISLLIKATTKGPVFFKQQRVGQFGKKFTFLKFRSMYVNNDSTIHREYVTNLIKGNTTCGQSESAGEKAPVYKIKGDPRITPIGRFLRKSSLDELPQFLNVLKGDMSLVGPRPPIPYEFENYDTWHRERLIKMKPGITGLWQVVGRSTTSFDEMVRLDVKYLRKWSLWWDVAIIFKTPLVMLKGKGAH